MRGIEKDMMEKEYSPMLEIVKFLNFKPIYSPYFRYNQDKLYDNLLQTSHFHLVTDI